MTVLKLKDRDCKSEVYITDFTNKTEIHIEREEGFFGFDVSVLNIDLTPSQTIELRDFLISITQK